MDEPTSSSSSSNRERCKNPHDREDLDSRRVVAIGGGVVGASSPPLSHRNGWRSLGVPRSLIWPSTMHNKRALDGRLCRAVARLLVTMAWPPLGGSTRNTWQTRKQCARAALRRDFAHLGCAHANKLSPPLSLFSPFPPSLSFSLFASPSSSTFAKYTALFLRGCDYAATSVSTGGLMTGIRRCGWPLSLEMMWYTEVKLILEVRYIISTMQFDEFFFFHNFFL